MDKIKIIKQEGIKEISVPEYGHIQFIVQNGKIHRVEVTESTIIKKANKKPKSIS
ncbi:hypothetical protein TEHD86_1800 [Tetragenococcus halophilus subsp. halophilus]|uniref:hypothetical protein n=1 Tax=Tetragenococcus halophilus TaxID=51669 RepID=UPI000CA72D92|nr:hypothetical protein [Tetragenococcus halophilus]GBD79453.1 hypothetical protein TEHD10_0516 [Tetragenococcus halophilus subsp. halophilus]GBD83078.1 hypothetical protein TEHD86_1800 [Tetragenococcus halophilus subsp. halophilus]GFK22829.1 hypothetical protein WJ7_22920 [Tetragenococcus halophilus]GLL52225.1 hypothetical protein YA5_022030 [Tetragenococcus halophilus]